MRNPPPFRLLAAVLILMTATWTAPASGAAAATAVAAPAAQSVGDAEVARARALMRLRRYDEALAVLRPLVEGDRVEANALFNFGLAAIGAAELPGVPEDRRDALLDEAIAAFHGILVRRPDLVRVRLELGRAFFLKGRDPLARLRGADALAREHFERVLASDPPAAVVLNVNRFLARMRARKDWTVRLGFALAPDTNLGGSSGDDIIWIPVGGQRLPFTLDRPAEKSSGIGIVAWAGGEYQYPLAREWRLRAGGQISRREYRDEEFDRMTVSAHLGPRWLVGRLTEASLLASARRHWLANEPDHRDLGFRGELRRRLTPRMAATLQVSRHERRYDERDHLDGPITDVSLTASHALGPTLRADAGLGWGREKPETKRWRHERRWLRAGMTFALPWGFTVGGSGTLRWSDYEGNWFPYTEDGSPRRDITRNFRVDVHNRGFTVGGFSPQVSLVREDRLSNAQLHDYERTSGELRFVRLF